MKLSIAISLLVFVPAALAYTPGNFGPSFVSPQIQTPSSPSALGYIEDSSVQEDAVDMTFIAKEDPIIAALATHLKFTEDSLRDEYSEWLVKYDKTPIEARYATFKQNFLVQEAWNRDNGQSFTLNEYGDNTEEEFKQLKTDTVAVVVIEPLRVIKAAQMIETIAEPTIISVAMTEVAKEDPVSIALATQLEITEDTLSGVYAEWLVKYKKTFVEARYATFKNNFLVQEAWNRDNGQCFTLNEYGDNTEEEFKQMKACAFNPIALEPLPLVEEDKTVKDPKTAQVIKEEVVKDFNGSTYIDALANPDMALRGVGKLISYLDSMPASESSILPKGKTSSITSYLDASCESVLEIPSSSAFNFLDCDVDPSGSAFNFLDCDVVPSGSAFAFFSSSVPSNSAFTILGSDGPSKQLKVDARAAFVIRPPPVAEGAIVKEPKAAQMIEEDMAVIEEPTVSMQHKFDAMKVIFSGMLN